MAQVILKNVGTETWTGTDQNKQVNLGPGDEHVFSSACSVIRYMNTNSGSVVDSPDGSFAKQVNKMAEDEGDCPGLKVGSNPAATPASLPAKPGPGGDSPNQQG